MTQSDLVIKFCVLENQAIPEIARLSDEELIVDKDYFDHLKNQLVIHMSELHKECAYEAEKSEKLKVCNSKHCLNLLIKITTY